MIEETRWFMGVASTRFGRVSLEWFGVLLAPELAVFVGVASTRFGRVSLEWFGVLPAPELAVCGCCKHQVWQGITGMVWGCC